MVVTVRVEDDGPPPEALLQAVGVQLRLPLPDHGVTAGALGLHQPQRLAVIAPEHVVDETPALVVRHPGNLEQFLYGGPRSRADLAEEENFISQASQWHLGLRDQSMLRGSDCY